MNVGEASKVTGLPVKTIRYYDEIGLIHPSRDHNGYREFDDPCVHKMHFVKRARGLGFSVEDCRTLLSLSMKTKSGPAPTSNRLRVNI